MAPGSDGDDEELVEIELEEELPPPLPPERARTVPVLPVGAAPPVVAEETTADDDIVADIVEVRQPMAEAAEEDARADRRLYEAEADAAAATAPARRAVLLLEAARLVDGPPAEVLEATRRAFAADPGLPVALWPLRRLLAAGGHWQELSDSYAAAADACAPSAAANATARAYLADLRVERGRVLEDHLDRDADAIASYRQALHAVPDHVGALLALLLVGARRQEAEVIAPALAGLARRAGGAQHAALAIEEARAWRPTGADGAGRALAVLEAELAGAGGEASPQPSSALLVELESLTAADVPPDVALRALAELARRSAVLDVGFAVALWRERARLALRRTDEPGVALESLDEAARLEPTHPIVALERLQLAAALGRGDVVDAMAAEMLDVAADDDQAVDVALLHAELASRGGRDAAVRATLEHARVQARRGERGDLRALEMALAVRRRDAEALHAALVDEAGRATGRVGADVAAAAGALVGAGAIRQWRLDDVAGAEQLYRRALERSPTHAPALHALVALLETDGRGADAAALLETALTRAAAITTMFEVWAREMLVSIHADEMGEPAKALEHQWRLVELAPKDVGRRVRLADIDLHGTLTASARTRSTTCWRWPRGRAIRRSRSRSRSRPGARCWPGRRIAQRARGAAMLRALAAVDASGLAASGRANADVVRGAGRGGRRGGRRRRGGRAGRGGARDALPPRPSPRGRRPLRRGAGRADAVALGGGSAGARLELRAGAAFGRGDPRGRHAVRGDRGRRTTCSATGVRPPRARGSAGARRRSARRRRDAPAHSSRSRRHRSRPRWRRRWRCCAIAATDRGRRPTRCRRPPHARWRRRAPTNRCLAANAAREAALVRAAVGTADAATSTTREPTSAGAGARRHGDRQLAGGIARVGAAAVADALLDWCRWRARAPHGRRAAVDRGRAGAGGCARAAGGPGRGRSGGAAGLGAGAHRAALAPALSDLPVPPDGAWPAERPDTRRARARRVGGAAGDRARAGRRARRRTARAAGDGAVGCTAPSSASTRSGWRRGPASGASRAPGATSWARRGRSRGWRRSCAIPRRRPRCSTRRRRRTSGQGASTTRSRRWPSASSCARRIRRRTCGLHGLLRDRPGRAGAGGAVRRAAVTPAGGGADDDVGAGRVVVRTRATPAAAAGEPRRGLRRLQGDLEDSSPNTAKRCTSWRAARWKTATPNRLPTGWCSSWPPRPTIPARPRRAWSWRRRTRR